MSKQTFHLPTWRRKPTADEAAPPRRGQRSKSPAEPDFYGDFYAALCGAPVLPVLPKAKCGRRLRPSGAKGTLDVPFLFSRREKVSAWELSDDSCSAKSEHSLSAKPWFRDRN